MTEAPMLAVQRACAGRTPTSAQFECWVSAALEGAQAEPAAVSLRVVDEPEGAALNEAWRGRAGPTNVLSFPADLSENPAVRILGDLVLCAPVVRREARAQRKGQRAHWAHLVIHGTLHLLGYDHEDDGDAQVMEALEREVLSSLGFPDPYREENERLYD